MTLGTVVTFFFFFFNDTATTEIYTLSLHDALPIYFARISSPTRLSTLSILSASTRSRLSGPLGAERIDRKSTRLNSSHTVISYAVFCLKKKQHKCSQLLRLVAERSRHVPCINGLQT